MPAPSSWSALFRVDTNSITQSNGEWGNWLAAALILDSFGYAGQRREILWLLCGISGRMGAWLAHDCENGTKGSHKSVVKSGWEYFEGISRDTPRWECGIFHTLKSVTEKLMGQNDVKNPIFGPKSPISSHKKGEMTFDVFGQWPMNDNDPRC